MPEPRSKKKRRWLPRFGMRTLLLFIMVVACFCAWFFYYVNRARQEAALVDEIQILEPSLSYDYQFNEDTGSYDAKSRLAPGPKFLKRQFGENVFSTVEVVHIGSVMFLQGGLGANNEYPKEVYTAFEKVSEFRNLLHFSVVNRGFKDLGMISRIPKLESLQLMQCGTSDLSPLASTTRLERLSLVDCNEIRDLTPIRGLGNLKALYFNHLRCDDYSAIGDLPNLKVLVFGFHDKDVDDWSWLSKIESLEEAYLAGSSFKELPSLKNLARLKKLDLSYCKALESTLPVLEAKQLTHLWLSDNALQILDRIDELPNLEELHLRGVEFLSEELAALKKRVPQLKVHLSD